MTTNICLGLSMALGDPEDEFAVSVVVHICDEFGECAKSNLILLKVILKSLLQCLH